MDKLSWNDEDRHIHFRLDEAVAKKRGLSLAARYALNPKKYKGDSNVTFPFTIANVDLFVFSTSICILAFELRFQDDDPYKIAAAQYYLRKISTEQIHRVDDSYHYQPESFVEISERILKDAASSLSLDFFFYATPNNEKANFLTYIDVPEQASYDRELFFLKWCYHDKFDYNNADYDDSEDYRASECTVWGLSPSAAACLVTRKKTQIDFIENIFQRNFRKQYLLTYILLHQKYMMYFFLTKMTIGLEGNLVQLEKYKSQLFDFETHYMSSYISEVPQYQRFYTKVRKAFLLNELFSDVQEPLLQLTEIKKEQSEKKRREYDDRINTALTTLSLLTIVYALTDASGITANMDWFLPGKIARVIQMITLIGVAIISMIMLCRLLFLKKH